MTRKSRELEFRSTVTASLLGTLDLDEIASLFLAGVVAEGGPSFERAFLFLADETGRAIRLHGSIRGPHEGYAHAQTGPLADFCLPWQDLVRVADEQQRWPLRGRGSLASALAWCLLHRLPLSSNSLELVHGSDESTQRVVTFSRFALVPLVADDRLVGAVLADHQGRRTTSAKQQQALQSLADLAALAMDRAQAHARVVALVELDELTRIHNRRYFTAELHRLFEVSRQSGRPLSLVVIDVDDFKWYNDTYGHLVGDRILQDLARLLEDNSRAGDVVARFAGDEFVILLPNADLAGAREVADRLRQKVERASLARGRARGLTISLGVASSGREDTPQGLFEHADQALYEAKSRGRNTVATSGLRSSGFLNIACFEDAEQRGANAKKVS